MTIRTAQNFMKCAERFGNTKSISHLNSTQMIQLLALPAEDTEKFIAEKTAKGTPVEDMTVKQLRAEVAEYKAQLEQKNSEVTDLFAENERLKEDKSKLAQVAERFGTNYHTCGNFSFSQMRTMLALPEGEEEKFIAEMNIDVQILKGKPADVCVFECWIFG